MEEKIENTVVEAEIEIKPDSLDVNDSPKGEDIYVENDPCELDRMLGIAPSNSTVEEEEEKSDNEDDENKEEELGNTEDDLNRNNDIEEDIKDLENNVEKEVEKEPTVLLSDFMYEDKDSFTYLSHNADSYQVNSIPLEDKRSIRQAVKSSNYIFRYPKYILKDKVLGFSTYEPLSKKKEIGYVVYFPEYTLSFVVDEDHEKPYSVSFKEYFEDLVTRIRPTDLTLKRYEKAITINSLKVVETGIIEVVTKDGTKHLLLNNSNVSFHRVLDYIRELSDQGEETLTLNLLPEFFVEI